MGFSCVAGIGLGFRVLGFRVCSLVAWLAGLGLGFNKLIPPLNYYITYYMILGVSSVKGVGCELLYYEYQSIVPLKLIEYGVL